MENPNPHGALLTVDAAALVENWKLLNARAKPADCAAVVKANGYGLGIEVVVPALAKAGCHTFFVAHLEEAMRTRKAAPMANIYVLNGLINGSESIYKAYRLRPVLGTVSEIGRWRKAGAGACALHVDTGMNRLGLPLSEAKALASMEETASLGVELLLSHLVSSELPEDAMNEQQMTRFARVADWFGERVKKRSLANSSAHFLPGIPRYEMTRAGYALYGGNPTPGKPNPMQAVVKLEAVVLQVRALAIGEHVGYNAGWTAERASSIATISLGYADGWLRTMSATNTQPGGFAMVNAQRCPLVGRISMDLVTLDVTDCPAGSVKPGQRVTLIGDGISLDDVAAMAGTNGYEILTSLGGRYQRRVING